MVTIIVHRLLMTQPTPRTPIVLQVIIGRYYFVISFGCYTGDTTIVHTVCDVLIDVHCSLSLSIQDGVTPLMAASIKGYVDVVRVLIEAHAHLNQRAEVMYIKYSSK